MNQPEYINETNQPEEKPIRLSPSFLEWVEAMVSALVVVVLIFTFILHTNTVMGRSMLPTLVENDQLLVSRLFYKPEQGDIVIISKSSFRDYPIVKRIIAVADQTVDIDEVTGEVTVDGKVLDEPYLNPGITQVKNMEFPATVPDGCVFVMGDNRMESDDSRNTQLGFVEEGYIQGKVLFRYRPLSRFGLVE